MTASNGNGSERSAPSDGGTSFLLRQLLEYARDLRQAIDGWHLAEGQLDSVYRELGAYARDLRRSLTSERERAEQLERERYEAARVLLGASAIRDAETGAHLLRIERYVALFASRLGWDEDRVACTASAATLHDLGKIGLPDAVLGKPGPLDENERKLVREHPLIGSRLLAGSASPVLRVAEAIARAHHERWDGSGYPAGLRGDEIPVEARIVAVVDTYDALRSPRSYKRPYPHEEAVAVILRGDGRTLPVHFDPALLVLLAEIAPELDRIWRESPEGHGLAGNASPPLSQPNRA